MAIIQRVQMGKWHNVYGNKGKWLGDWMVFKSDTGFSYKGHTPTWDLNGGNPDYPTATAAAKAAIANVKHPD